MADPIYPDQLEQSMDDNNSPPTGGAGWQTTNSHPAKSDFKVSKEGRVLAAGFENLNLALSLLWVENKFLNYINGIKEHAMGKEAASQASMVVNGDEWVFNVAPYGQRGYTYVLENSDYMVKLGNWVTPRSRPSAMVEIRSQALWQHGVVECIDRILQFFDNVGGKVLAVKASRVDACLDILLPNTVWRASLRRHRICWARNLTTHEVGERLTGYEIGTGVIRARLYDKDEEIRVKSKKTWMYDIWKLPEVPSGSTPVRVEFQLRREVLRELGIDSIWDLVNHPRSIWTYCTSKLLKFVVNAKEHGDHRTLMPWWQAVLNGFHESQGAHPFIRAKIVEANKTKLAQQLMGQFSSLIAVGCEEAHPCVRLEEQLPLVPQSAKILGIDDDELSRRVQDKVAKYKRGTKKFRAAEQERKRLGLPQITSKPHPIVQ